MPLEGINLPNTLILDFYPLEPWGNKFMLFKPPRSWYLVTADLVTNTTLFLPLLGITISHLSFRDKFSMSCPYSVSPSLHFTVIPNSLQCALLHAQGSPSGLNLIHYNGHVKLSFYLIFQQHSTRIPIPSWNASPGFHDTELFTLFSSISGQSFPSFQEYAPLSCHQMLEFLKAQSESPLFTYS